MKDLRTFQILADYHQFYLMDATVEPPIPKEISEQDMLRRLRTAPHIVVFHTESASQVSVQVTFGTEPFEAEGPWEHQADFSLALPSGTAVLCGCTDYVPQCPRLFAEPMTYRGRAYFASSAVASERCLIMLWPAAAEPIAPGDAPTSGASLS